jgi:transcriptional regulator with XRE-family HTH domain
LAALLRQLRTEAGLRQTDLAKNLKEPQSFVSKYESGEQGLDIFEVRDICEALGTSLSALMARFEKEG